MEPIKTIGKILDSNEERRDAIHIAIVPAIAAENLWAGNKVSLVYGTTDQVKRQEYSGGSPIIGVVDPFLNNFVRKGQKFWLFLYPNSVTGLQHVWTHPAFDCPQMPKNEHEKWLREFADKWNFNYAEMIEAALSDDEEPYVVAQGVDLHSPKELGGDFNLFWEHLEGLTGKQFDVEHRSKLAWSCSC